MKNHGFYPWIFIGKKTLIMLIINLMSLFLIFSIITFYLTIYCFLYIFLSKKSVFCDNFNSLKKIITNKSPKLSFKKLSKSSAFSDSVFVTSNYGEPLFFEKQLTENKKFLLTLSKFIDFKINSTKQTFRSKKNFVLIEQIAHLCSWSILNDDFTRVYFQYNKLSKYFHIRQKEDKVFKFLLAKNFFKILSNLKNESLEIKRVIEKSKTTTKFRKHKKQILNSAEIYAIKKFNPNSTKLLIDIKNQHEQIDAFLCELVFIDNRIKAIISYLTVIFS